MRPAIHVFVSLAGASVFAAGAWGWCALSGPVYEAGALAIVQSGGPAPAPVDIASLRSLIGGEPVLRRAALRPEAASAIERTARPSLIDRVTALVAAPSSDIDTLSRAATSLPK